MDVCKIIKSTRLPVSKQPIKHLAVRLLAGLLYLLSLNIAASETSLRLAFVYNFIKFIEWPAESTQINLCVLGDRAELAEALTPISQKTVSNYSINVIHFHNIPSKSNQSAFVQCQMLYVVIPSLLSKINKLPQGVVIVTDDSNVDDLRISFTIVKAKENRIEFLVNTKALAQAKVTASSQLLKLAKNYQGAEK